MKRIKKEHNSLTKLTVSIKFDIKKYYHIENERLTISSD